MAAEVTINYLAVLLAAIASMIIGAAWYSPLLFGNLWMNLSGIKKEDIEKAKQKGMAKNYAITFVSSLVMSYVLSHFVRYVEATDILGGITLALWLWLGFIATVTLGSVLWEGKSLKLYILNNGHNLLSLAVMSIILTLWA